MVGRRLRDGSIKCGDGECECVVAPTLSGVRRLSATSMRLTFSRPQGQTYQSAEEH